MNLDQANALRQRMNGEELDKAKTIAVISGKGGVGKSNITLNFALSLIKQEKSVLVVDLDIGMGNIDIMLGLQAQHSIVDMYEQQLEIDQIIERTEQGLAYIAAGSGLSQIFHMDEAKFSYFLDQFESLMRDYDYIFFDMGAGATKDSLFYILAADECFVVTTPEPTAMMDAYAMIKHVHLRNPSLPFFVMMNRAETIKEGKKAMQRIEKVVNQFLNKKIIPLGILTYDKLVSRAVIRQTPFIELNPYADVSKQLRSIVDQYLAGDINLNKQKGQTFISKLKSFIKER